MNETGGEQRAIVVTGPVRNKIAYIKLIRAFTGLGLKESKDISDEPTPCTLAVCDARTAEMFIEAASKICGRPSPFELCEHHPEMVPLIDPAARFGFEGMDGAVNVGCVRSAAVLLLVGGAALTGVIGAARLLS